MAESADRTPRRAAHGKLNMRDAAKLSEAWVFAIRLGNAPTLFVSVNWSEAQSCEDLVLRIGKVRDAMKAFLTRHGVPVVWLEVREKPRKGEGVHWAIYVPTDLIPAFSAALTRWVAMGADEVSDRAVDVRLVGPRWWDRRDYMLKGGNEKVRKAYKCSRFDKNGSKASQGIIHGPRLRVAHSIGQTARKASLGLTQGVEGLKAVA